jgi:hypothetical protein
MNEIFEFKSFEPIYSNQINFISNLNMSQKTNAPQGDPALKRSFKGHKDGVCSVAFNPNLK